ncbi:MAG: phosphoenolpyruvate--protein phosphotransferase, partial [Lachnospiraceae bacterium]
MFIDIFMSMEDEIFKQRAADINDVRVRMLKILMNIEDYDLSKLPPDTVLITHELPPSVTAVMDVEHIAGIVTEVGGPTSHAAILSRALEIPAVLSVKQALATIKNGDEVIVDGNYGEVFVNPSHKTKTIYEDKIRKCNERNAMLKEFVGRETATKDGRKVVLAANIGNSDDAIRAMECGAEGVGLFRTEFLFMNGSGLPTEDEQFEAYKKALIVCKDKEVIIRTLDIGGDKDIPYMGLSKEANPFLGYRGIRYCLDRTDVFYTQLRALLRASAFGKMKLMIPMVTSINEVRTFKHHINFLMEELRLKEIPFDENLKIGVMIETPAAARIADLMAKEVDFFSIGTNDLIQYTIAVDRGNEMVSYLYTPLHPAVLRSIKSVIQAGKKAGITVGMCGEAAADTRMLPLLISFGLDEYSVTSSSVLETRKNISEWSVAKADEVTARVMAMDSEFDIADYLNEVVRSRE